MPEDSQTDAEVVIPITNALAKELETPLPIEGLTLIVGTRGRPIRGDVLYHSIKKEAARLGIEDMKPLHGLRKNAVMTFLEHGLDYQMIRAITGQSDEMIRYYGQNYDRHRVVDRAELLLIPGKDKKLQ
ncbi:MAG: tyrosine-type recombinase/integrase [Geminicoccaceae bacterium]